MDYDLILVFTTFRKCGVYLSLVKELTKLYKIGIYVCPLEKADSLKTREQNECFLGLLQTYNTEFIYSGKVICKTVVIPQWHYTPGIIDKIYSDIDFDVSLWMIGLATGNYAYEHLNGHQIDKVLVVDRKFYDFRLSKRPLEKALGILEDKIVEVGEPYLAYPVFKDILIDYIVANPTPFSFPNHSDKLKYLDNLLSLLMEVPPEENVAYKPHNAMGEDSLIHPKIFKMVSLIPDGIFRKTLYAFTRRMKGLVKSDFATRIFSEVEIIEKYSKIMRRVTPLNEITPYHQFNLEMFLPNVRKGIITGRSNTIWHGLFAKCPVYNCVADETCEISKEKMHSYNMRYFDVACCHGHFTFDERKYDIIEDGTRSADFIEVLKTYL